MYWRRAGSPRWSWLWAALRVWGAPGASAPPSGRWGKYQSPAQCKCCLNLSETEAVLRHVVNLTFCSNPFCGTQDLGEVQEDRAALLLFAGQAQQCQCGVGGRRRGQSRAGTRRPRRAPGMKRGCGQVATRGGLLSSRRVCARGLLRVIAETAPFSWGFLSAAERRACCGSSLERCCQHGAGG